MKAVYIEAHGGTEALVYGDRPEPEVGPGEVKVQVKASALNRLDLYTRGRWARLAARVSTAAYPWGRLRRRCGGDRRECKEPFGPATGW